MAYETDLQHGPHRSWIFCGGDSGCNRWIQVDINATGGIDTTLMPKDYHFDFERVATLVKGT